VHTGRGGCEIERRELACQLVAQVRELRERVGYGCLRIGAKLERRPVRLGAGV
jgi:hypothetical protein